MLRLGEPVLDIVRLADHVEAHLPRPGGVAVARLLGKLDAIVGQDRLDAVGYGCEQVFEELPSRSPVSLVDKLGDRKFNRAVDADEQIELAFSGLHLGDIDVKEADRVALEALSLRLVALNVRQAGGCRDAAGIGGVLTASDTRSTAATHKGSHPRRSNV